MYSLRKTVQLIAVACFVSVVYTETPIKSEITGYGTSFIRTCWSCYVLTIIGYASSSNTLSTGAQAGEHSATFADPGDCATNLAVYPVNTKIYVVVGARLIITSSTLHMPVSTTVLLSITNTAPYIHHSSRWKPAHTLLGTSKVLLGPGLLRHLLFGIPAAL